MCICIYHAHGHTALISNIYTHAHTFRCPFMHVNTQILVHANRCPPSHAQRLPTPQEYDPTILAFTLGQRCSHWVAWMLLAEPRPTPGISQSPTPSIGPHQPPHTSPCCTRQNHLLPPPSSFSISEGPGIWGIPLFPKPRGNKQCSRTCMSW